MELHDCAFPLLQSIVPTADLDEGFRDVNWALLVGSVPRKAGMERKDLLGINGKIFVGQGQAIERNAAADVRILVVGNPCNTNCLIAMNNAKEIPRDRWFAMTRLDENRARAQLAHKAGVEITRVTNMTIWGNHSSTQYPDFYNAKIDNKPADKVIGDEKWLKERFHRDGAAARRGHHQSARAFLGRFRGERRHRYGAFSHERYAGRRLAQRRALFGWKLRRRERFDLVVSDARSRRKTGDRAKTSDQRFQPRQDRQIRRRVEGREIAGQRLLGE